MEIASSLFLLGNIIGAIAKEGTDRGWVTLIRGRLHIVPILAFPAILTIGILIIPVVSDYSNHYLAGQAVGQTTR